MLIEKQGLPQLPSCLPTALSLYEELLADHHAPVAQPFDDVWCAGAVQRIELNAGVSFGVHPHDFTFAFDSWAGRQIESELHRNPALKETKRSNSHSSLAQIRSKC